ncbi:MAG: DUF1810 domain-containing protein [Janthinobacterium lividum]
MSALSLERFVAAQAPVYDTVCAELAAGAKRTHWMWFVFPQLRALGRSGTARHFGLTDLAEAVSYLRHPVLGARLVRCCDIVLGIEGKSAHRIFGSPDDLKLCSCMTLFEAAASRQPEASEDTVFGPVLDRYFAGRRDPLTCDLLFPNSRGR